MGVENFGTRGTSKAPSFPSAWASRLCPAPSAARRHRSGPGLRGEGSAWWHLRWQQGWGPGPPHTRLHSLHLHTHSSPVAGTCWDGGQEGPPGRGGASERDRFHSRGSSGQGPATQGRRAEARRGPGVSGSWLWGKSGCKVGWGQRDEKGGCGGCTRCVSGTWSRGHGVLRRGVRGSGLRFRKLPLPRAPTLTPP